MASCIFRVLSIFVFTFFLLGPTESLWGSIITAQVNNGIWNSASTWDLNRLPATDDQVIIPHGITVKVNNNMYHGVPVYPLLQITIRGTLLFIGSGQINLACGSSLCTESCGSIPSTGSNSNQITIGPGLAPWKGAQATVDGGDCVFKTSCPPPTLPVVLREFSVNEDGGSIKIEWWTESEENFSQYEVEYSVNGYEFATVKTVKGEQRGYYQVSLPSERGYYRLKMTDLDGSFDYSEAIYMSGSTAEVLLFPNPASEVLNVQSGEPITYLFIRNSHNQLCYEQRGLMLTASISVNHLNAGVYHVYYESNGVLYSKLLSIH